MLYQAFLSTNNLFHAPSQVMVLSWAILTMKKMVNISLSVSFGSLFGSAPKKINRVQNIREYKKICSLQSEFWVYTKFSDENSSNLNPVLHLSLLLISSTCIATCRIQGKLKGIAIQRIYRSRINKEQ